MTPLDLVRWAIAVAVAILILAIALGVGASIVAAAIKEVRKQR